MAKKKITLPDNLSDEAKEFIDNVISTLMKQDKLESVDAGALYMLAVNYEKFLRCEEMLEREGYIIVGQRNTTPHPAIRISKDCQNLILDIMKQFGLTLKSRTNLKVVDGGEDDTLLNTYLKKNLKK